MITRRPADQLIPFAASTLSGARSVNIAADIDSADLSGVSGTPTFLINGRRHHGAYNIGTLYKPSGRPVLAL